MIFRINECLIDTHAFEVRRNGRAIPVQPQVLDLLILLLENRDRLVSKDEIVERIWHGRAVSDAALDSRIKSARQAIGDSGASQELIRTVRGRGFRFVGKVSLAEVVGDRETTAASADMQETPIAAFDLPAVSGIAVAECGYDRGSIRTVAGEGSRFAGEMGEDRNRSDGASAAQLSPLAERDAKPVAAPSPPPA